MANLVIKQGEAKNITLTVTDQDSAAVDLSAATLFLGIKKEKSDAAYAFSKDDADFDKSQAASGIILFFITADESNQLLTLPLETFTAELKATFPGSPESVEISADFYLIFEQSGIPVV